jgi:hypothetical protein
LCRLWLRHIPPIKDASGARHQAKLKKWSAKVTRESRALDLEKGVFQEAQRPRHCRLFEAVGGTADRRRKAAPLPSAMSMLTFLTSTVPARSCRRAAAARSEKAKDELRKLFH